METDLWILKKLLVEKKTWTSHCLTLDLDFSFNASFHLLLSIRDGEMNNLNFVIEINLEKIYMIQSYANRGSFI